MYFGYIKFMTKTTIKRYLISSLVTFLGSFFLVTGGIMMEQDFMFTKAAIIAATFSGLMVGARAVAKIVYEVGYDLLSAKK